MVPLDVWGYLKSVKDEKPFNNKTYDVNPELKTEEGVDMVDEQGKVVGNHGESFTPVEDKKVAAVEVEVGDKKVAADGLRLVRDIVLKSETFKRYHPNELRPGLQFQSDEELVKEGSKFTQTIFHPVGTCKMGNDDNSVVND